MSASAALSAVPIRRSWSAENWTYWSSSSKLVVTLQPLTLGCQHGIWQKTTCKLCKKLWIFCLMFVILSREWHFLLVEEPKARQRGKGRVQYLSFNHYGFLAQLVMELKGPGLCRWTFLCNVKKYQSWSLCGVQNLELIQINFFGFNFTEAHCRVHICCAFHAVVIWQSNGLWMVWNSPTGRLRCVQHTSRNSVVSEPFVTPGLQTCPKNEPDCGFPRRIFPFCAVLVHRIQAASPLRASPWIFYSSKLWLGPMWMLSTSCLQQAGQVCVQNVNECKSMLKTFIGRGSWLKIVHTFGHNKFVSKPHFQIAYFCLQPTMNVWMWCGTHGPSQVGRIIVCIFASCLGILKCAFGHRTQKNSTQKIWCWMFKAC